MEGSSGDAAASRSSANDARPGYAGPESASATAGRVLGDFRIIREVGRGGMGVVFEAEQISLGRRVALKVLPAHVTLHDRAIERFEREAKAAARLRHPGIVEVLAVGEQDGAHFFAMEFVEGTPLDRLIERMRIEGVEAFRVSSGAPPPSPGPKPPGPRPAGSTSTAAWNKSYIETAVRLVASVADALDHAHGQGVVHRDVKPSNILLRRDGSPALTDFGLAREEGFPSLTHTGEFAGTPYYVSPEQAMARRMKVDHRTDVFSLGVTLYELLTLERPFPGDTTQEVLGRIVTKEPPDPQRLNPRLAPDLATIVLKTLEKDPDRRYGSAGAMAADLRAFLEYRPITARRASVPTRIRRWARREPAKAALVGVLLLGVPIVAGLGGWILAKRPELRAAAEQARRERIERLLERGYLNLTVDLPDAAASAFEQVLALDPSNTEAIAGIAFAHLGAGRSEEGRAHLTRRRAEARDPSALDRMRVFALILEGREPEGAELHRRLGEPEAPLDLGIAAFGYLRQAAAGDRASAVRAAALLERAILLSPSARPFFHFFYGSAARVAGDEAAARECVDAIEALWPDSAVARVWVARILSGLDPPRVVAAARRAIELDPTLEAAQLELGRALREGGDLPGAVAAYRRALEIVPQSDRLRSALCSALTRGGDLAGARAELEAWTRNQPESPSAWNDLAWYMVNPANPREVRDPVAALLAARRAVELSKGCSPAILDTLAEAQFANGDFAAAVATEEEALVAVSRLIRPNPPLRQSIEASLARFRSAASASATRPTTGPGGN